MVVLELVWHPDILRMVHTKLAVGMMESASFRDKSLAAGKLDKLQGGGKWFVVGRWFAVGRLLVVGRLLAVGR